jgi:outer membrane protein, heavy metal efflux system
VEQALARRRAAEVVIRDYQQGVLDQARRLLDASRTGFQAGATSVIALLEAQRTFRSVQTEYTNALAAYALAQAELERSTGAVPAALLPVAGSPARRPQ